MSALRTIIKNDWCFLLIITLLALGLRLDLLIADHFAIDADEAIVGLMSKHINEGSAWPIFYYGQHYMGTLESILISLLSQFIGLENYTLKLVPLAFGISLVVIYYLICHELTGRLAARLAGLLTAIAPVTLMIWSSKARGGFIEMLAIGSLAILILIRAIKYQQINYRSLGAIAFLLGVGWWVNNQILYFMLPVFISVVGYAIYHLSVKKTLQLLCFSIASFLVGSLPFWIYNLQNNFASFEIFTSSGESKVTQYLANFFEVTFPIATGARGHWSFVDSYPGSSAYLAFIYLLIFCTYLFLRSRKIAQLLILRLDWAKPLEILLLLAMTVILVFSFSSYGHLAEDPRYVLPIYLPLICLTACIIAEASRTLRVPSFLIFGLLLVINFASCYYPSRNNMQEPLIKALDRASANHQELISWLLANKVSFVRTNYWIGYRLAFETKEQVRFMVFDEPARSRIDSYEKEGAAVRALAPYVLVRSQAVMLKKALDIQGYHYQEKVLSGYYVIFDIKPKQDLLLKIDPRQAISTIDANFNSDQAKLIIDQNLMTRWGSAHPQTKEMQISLKFRTPTTLRAFTYQLADWHTDYPRGLQIWIIDQNDQRIPLITGSDYYFIRYLLGSERQYSFFFDALKVKEVQLEQTGSDPFFDWSIAELEFYQ